MPVCVLNWLATAEPLLYVVAPNDFDALQTIEKIKKENERLKEQLAAESQSNAQQAEGIVISMIAGLQETCERYTRKIDVEKRRLEELEKQSKMMHVNSLLLQEKRTRPILLIDLACTELLSM